MASFVPPVKLLPEIVATLSAVFVFARVALLPAVPVKSWVSVITLLTLVAVIVEPCPLPAFIADVNAAAALLLLPPEAHLKYLTETVLPSSKVLVPVDAVA